jgi:hypothetical protein
MSKRKPPALNWQDPAAVRAWLDELQAVALDVIAIAEDQTRPLAQRDIGRAEAVRILVESAGGLEDSIAFARRGLPKPEAPPAKPTSDG